jgi:NAD kinase
LQEEVDLILVVGGESAVKYAAIMLQNKARPVLCISKDEESMLGSIKLANWQNELPKVMENILKEVYFK